MKYNLRDKRETLCCVADETPMGFNTRLGQELFGGESLLKEGDEKRHETKQIRGGLGRCSR